MPSRPADPILHLVVDGRTVAPLEVAAGGRSRTRGLLGRDHLEGALLLAPTRSVHTFGMRFPIDVALCDRALRVIAVRTLVPGCLVLPRRLVRAIVEAEAGAFASWGLIAGSTLAVSEC
ncbi:DUF192 domain-containing protein [Aquihabitans daechungensis]|uniref:DUF192 domain-containing protein n=1 Tax=Aquihabitans daechungensis TaxID=1052257 RepID=UPI003BA2DF32